MPRFKNHKKPTGLARICWISEGNSEGADIYDKNRHVGTINNGRVKFYTEETNVNGDRVFLVKGKFVDRETAKAWVKKNWDIINQTITLRDVS